MAKNMPFRPTGPAQPRLQAGLAQQNDIVDAEFEIISDGPTASISAPPLRKNWYSNPTSMRKSTASMPRSLHMRQTMGVQDSRFFEKAEEKRWVPWNGEPLSTPAFYTLAIAIMIVSFWISGGYNLFVTQETERPVVIKTQNLILDVRDVTWDVRYRATKPILFVSGEVYNPHKSANPPQNIVVLAQYKNGTQEKLFIPGHKQPLRPFSDYQFHGQLDLKYPEIASVSVELQKP